MSANNNRNRQTVSPTNQAVIYARVSKDASGVGRSVTEQIAECRRECKRRGWTVRDEVTDNDLSASRYARKGRPGFDSLPDTLKPGDVVVVWEQSRISRDPIEYLVFERWCETHGVTIDILSSPDVLDPSNPDHRLMSHVHAGIDAYHSEQTRRRVLRATDARAEKGLPHGKLPFGYVFGPEDGWKIDPPAADVVRAVVAGVLAGESMRSLADKYGLDRRQLARTLRSPAYVALRRHNGTEYQGKWESIISVDEHRRLLSVLKNPERKSATGPKPNHLMTGIGTCGICAATLRYDSLASVKKRTGNPQYRCPVGHVSRLAKLVDDTVVEVLFEYFDEVIASAATADAGGDRESEQAAIEARKLRQRMEAELIALHEADLEPEILGLQSKLVSSKYLPKIKKLESAAAQYVPPSAALKKFADADDVRAAWEDLTLDEQRTIVRESLSVSIPVLPKKGRDPRTLDPNSIVIFLKGGWEPKGVWQVRGPE